jgi:hypothetical protein
MRQGIQPGEGYVAKAMEDVGVNETSAIGREAYPAFGASVKGVPVQQKLTLGEQPLPKAANRHKDPYGEAVEKQSARKRLEADLKKLSSAEVNRIARIVDDSVNMPKTTGEDIPLKANGGFIKKRGK